MPEIRDSEYVQVHKDLAHATNQVSLVQLANGELLLGFNEERGPIHADSGQSCLIKSGDGGRTWDPASKRVVWPCTEHGGNWDCAFGQLRDGTILMHTRVCSFIDSTGAGGRDDPQALRSPALRAERLKRQTGYALLTSRDNGATWSDPVEVNTFPITSASLGRYACGNSGAGHVIELPDGVVLMPLCGTISNHDTTGPVGETGRSFLLRSDDGGDHWEHWSTIAYDPAHIIHFHEPGVTRLHDGRLIVLLRVSRRPGRYDNLWFACSEDDGASWSRPRRTSIWGYPADVTQLRDGRVLAVYGYRRPPWGVRGCVSADGVTWDVANEFAIREGGAASPEVPFYWHIGYPSVAQTPDGTIVTAYHEYSDDPQPVQFICCTRFHLD